MTLPVAVIRPDPPTPADIENGRLPVSMLTTMFGGTVGRIDHFGTVEAALAFTAMAVTFHQDRGRSLTYTGWYRSYAQQETLFRSRHQNTPVPGRKMKLWDGQQWWLRAGMANANIPGTSNHGWGVAGDLAIGTPQAPTSLQDGDIEWLVSNARTFGFWAENPAEAWHWVHHGLPVEDNNIMFRLIRPAGYYDIALLGGVVLADELDEHGVSKGTLTPDIVNDLVDSLLVWGLEKGARDYDGKAQVLRADTWALIVGRAPVGMRPPGEI